MPRSPTGSTLRRRGRRHPRRRRRVDPARRRARRARARSRPRRARRARARRARHPGQRRHDERGHRARRGRGGRRDHQRRLGRARRCRDGAASWPRPACTTSPMHWRGHVRPTWTPAPSTRDVVAEVRDELAARVDALVAAGVAPERLILDPGLGFGKTRRAELGAARSTRRARRARAAASSSARRRKRFLGALLPDDAAGGRTRDLPTAVISALAARAGRVGRARARRASDRAARSTSSERGRVDDVARTRDQITLTGLRVRAHHGVFEHEREQGQDFVIDVTVAVDLAAAAAGDDLGATVHYGELAEAVVAAVERDPVDLIETLAERVAAVALAYAGGRRGRGHRAQARGADRRCRSRDVAVTIVRRPRMSRAPVIAYRREPRRPRGHDRVAATRSVAELPRRRSSSRSRRVVRDGRDQAATASTTTPPAT